MIRIALLRPTYVVVSCANALDVLAARLIALAAFRRDVAVVAHFNSSWSFWTSGRIRKMLRNTSRSLRFFAIAPSQRAFFVDQGLTVEPSIFPNFFCYAPPVVASADNRFGTDHVVALYVGRIVEAPSDG